MSYAPSLSMTNSAITDDFSFPIYGELKRKQVVLRKKAMPFLSTMAEG